METPNYYAVIPANVRYDKRLKPNAKLLYGEITALASSKGYCYATNSYFAELYEVSIETISRWVAQLVEFGYVKLTIIYKEGTKNIQERRLEITDLLTKKSIPPRQKNQEGIDKKVNTPIDKKVKDNNTSNNTTDEYNLTNNLTKEGLENNVEKTTSLHSVKKAPPVAPPPPKVYGEQDMRREIRNYQGGSFLGRLILEDNSAEDFIDEFVRLHADKFEFNNLKHLANKFQLEFRAKVNATNKPTKPTNKKTTQVALQTNSAYEQCKTYFEDYKGNAYLFDDKEAKHLGEVLQKIVTVHQRTHQVAPTEEETVENFKFLLKNHKYEFFKKNCTLQMFDNQFNQIVNSINNGKSNNTEKISLNDLLRNYYNEQ